MVASDTSDQAHVNNCITSKMDVLGNAFFMSTALISLWMIFCDILLLGNVSYLGP